MIGSPEIKAKWGISVTVFNCSQGNLLQLKYHQDHHVIAG
jgi:hypothetical protein